MASGVTHTRDSLILAGASVTGLLLVRAPIEVVVLVPVGCLLGTLITPDLDLNNECMPYRVAQILGGTPLRMVWRLIWFPYSRAFSHRSVWTHTPILGTVLRILYLLLLYLAVAIIFRIGLPVPTWHWAFLIIGLMISDTLHYFRDLVPRRRRR